MRFRAASVTLVALLAVAALVAGCGGSSSTPSSAAPAKSKAAASTSGSASFASAGHCSAITGAGSQFEQEITKAMSGGHFNGSAIVAAYQNLANSAPSAIRPDLEIFAQGFSKFASVLSQSGVSSGSGMSAKEMAALTAIGKEFSAPKFKAAEQNLEAWAKANC